MKKIIGNLLFCLVAVLTLCQCGSDAPTMKIKKVNLLYDHELKGKVKKIKRFDLEYNNGKVEKGGMIESVLVDTFGNYTEEYLVAESGELTLIYQGEFYSNGYPKTQTYFDIYSGEKSVAEYKYNSNENSVEVDEYRNVGSSFFSRCFNDRTTVRKYDEQGNLIEFTYPDFEGSTKKEISKYDSQNRLVKKIITTSSELFDYADTISFKYTDNGKIEYFNGIEMRRFNEKGDVLETPEDEYSGKARYEYVYDSKGNVLQQLRYENIANMPPSPDEDSESKCTRKSDEVLRQKYVVKYDDKGNAVQWMTFRYDDCGEEIEKPYGSIVEYEYYE